MGLLVKLALRNLWRNRRRTVLTFSALAFGIACLIIVDSLMQGLTGMSERNLIALETGEIQIHAPGYFDQRDTFPLDITVAKAPTLEVVKNVPGVLAATPRVATMARLNVGWEEFPVMALAIDSSLDHHVLDLVQHVQGRMAESGKLEAVIGSGLAELLDIQIDDYITLIARTRSGAIEALDFIVTGHLKTPNPTVNHHHVYLPLDVIDRAFGMNGEVTEIIVRLDDGVSLEVAAANIQNALSHAGVDAEVFTWRQSAADFVALAQTSGATDMMLIGVILLIALVGVTNTILLSTLERTREIGTMKALGMREGELIRLFLLEATGIALLAVVAGSLLGAALNLYLITKGMNIESMIGEMDLGFPIDTVIYGAWNPSMYLGVAVLALVSCWIAAYFPARRAARLDPAGAMKN